MRGDTYLPWVMSKVASGAQKGSDARDSPIHLPPLLQVHSERQLLSQQSKAAGRERRKIFWE